MFEKCSMLYQDAESRPDNIRIRTSANSRGPRRERNYLFMRNFRRGN